MTGTLTRAGRVLAFIDKYILVPEGKLVGKRLILDQFQIDFIVDVYDNPHMTRQGILSIARKNGKSGLIACIVLAHTIGPERLLNSQIVSGAKSREQAGLVYSLAEKMLNLQPAFRGLYKCIPSSKKIIGLKANVEYKALAAEGTTAHGLSPVLAILDEVGQVQGSSSSFLDAVLTSQGAHDTPLTLMISTQASSDADFLSLRIDDALTGTDPHTICHVYEADKGCDLLDREQWKKANPALGTFRGIMDLEAQLKQASRIPSLEATARNLLLNQRISLFSLWLSPTVWKENKASPDIEAFRKSGNVSLGLDLSMRNDLTAAVLSCKDEDGFVHLLPFVFAPEIGMKERELRDKAPYTTWVAQGSLIAVPGATLDYSWLCKYLKLKLDQLGISVATVQFDRWRIKELQSAAAVEGFASEAVWVEIGQGYVGMSPRIEHFETYLLQGKIKHGSHPLLNMAAANAITVKDPANNRKLDKTKTTQRIDPIVAAVMSVGAYMEQTVGFDVGLWIA